MVPTLKCILNVPIIPSLDNRWARTRYLYFLSLHAHEKLLRKSILKGSVMFCDFYEYGVRLYVCILRKQGASQGHADVKLAWGGFRIILC